MEQRWPGFEARVEPRGDAVVVTAAGEVDFASSRGLTRALADARRISPVTVLDLTAIDFLDSSGLKVLLDFHLTGTLRVVPSPAVRRPLTVTGLDHTIVLCDDLAAALAGDGAGP